MIKSILFGSAAVVPIVVMLLGEIELAIMTYLVATITACLYSVWEDHQGGDD